MLEILIKIIAFTTIIFMLFVVVIALIICNDAVKSIFERIVNRTDDSSKIHIIVKAIFRITRLSFIFVMAVVAAHCLANACNLTNEFCDNTFRATSEKCEPINNMDSVIREYHHMATIKYKSVSNLNEENIVISTTERKKSILYSTCCRVTYKVTIYIKK